MARSLLADRCECSYEDDLAAALPHTVAYVGGDSLRADYRCQHCGREWSTNWSASAAGWPSAVPVIDMPCRSPLLEQMP